MKAIRLLLILTAILSLAGAPLLAAKDPKLRTIRAMMASPRHLKESLPAKTYLTANFKVSPNSAEIAKVIVNAGLDQVTQFLSLPVENAREPKPRKRAAPVYPYDLRRNGVSGWAAFVFLIGADGSVKSLYCYGSSNPQLAVAGAEALAEWKFEPAKVQGENVVMLASQLLEFNAD